MASSSFLLELPAELRNTICQFALTHSKSLHYYNPENVGDRPYLYLRDIPSQQVDDKKPVEYNQLKYVNKQLYAETAGLELKHNDITLSERSERFEHTSPCEVLSDWLSSISHTKRFWIKTIAIRCEWEFNRSKIVGESAETIARLTQLCNEIPSMRVKHYKPLWMLGSYRFGEYYHYFYYFFVSAQRFSYAYRGESFKDRLIDADSRHRAMICGKAWREDWGNPKVELAQLQAENLRYFPNIPEDFLVPVIKEDYTAATDNEVIPEAEQWIGNKYLREWMEHGI
jgi:hypothetical protein